MPQGVADNFSVSPTKYQCMLSLRWTQLEVDELTKLYSKTCQASASGCSQNKRAHLQSEVRELHACKTNRMVNGVSRNTQNQLRLSAGAACFCACFLHLHTWYSTDFRSVLRKYCNPGPGPGDSTQLQSYQKCAQVRVRPWGTVVPPKCYCARYSRAVRLPWITYCILALRAP